jgi:molybdopterin-containing oxidoreductase family iron-sulfur binding subunit
MREVDTKQESLDLAALRARLAGTRGREYWRSLEELAESESFQQLLEREFPEQASEWTDGVSRRRFLNLMAASLALAGLSSCVAPPTEKLVPYVRAPEEIIPGRPLFFATAMPLAASATGVLVESHMGRPIKIEGNPNHPASLGATDTFAQASILSLYDPDRSQVVSNAGRISTWSSFLNVVALEMEREKATGGAGLRLLTESVTSPTLARQIQELLAQFPEARWHQYEPVGRENSRAGARLAFGEDVNAGYNLEAADVILSLDSDFLCTGPGCLRYARQFAKRRRVEGERAEMNRLYVVESTPSNTGMMADHRLPLRASEIEGVARAVAAQLGIGAAGASPVAVPAGWVEAVGRDLQVHRGRSLVVAGESQPPVVHALAHAMNQALGNAGRTVVYTDPVEANPVDQTESLADLTREMADGQVDFLVILGGNPVYQAPADLNFAHHLSKVRLRVHLSLYEDETSLQSHWHLPETHYLETWGDTRAFDGTVTIMQPLIEPLYGGKSALEVVSALAGQPGHSSHDMVRSYWESQSSGGDFEGFWRGSLHDGLVPGTALPTRRPFLRPDFEARLTEAFLDTQDTPEGGTEIVFRPDPTIFDGRFANNGWLQELPKPLTTLTWDNAALVSPAAAQRLGLQNEDVVELRHGGRALRAPVWIQPGQAEDTVTLHLGYGRERTGRVGARAGFNAYALRTAGAPWFAGGTEIRKTGERYPLARTQTHHAMEGRHLVRVGTLEEYRHEPHFAQHMVHEAPVGLTLYPGHQYEGYAWGMAIDLNACTGCGACVVACQAENNIPIVGKEEVQRGREMHWIRVDRYYAGDLDRPESYPQPVPCMHCENAPCEPVCPVAATVHSSEGLNDMVYNRCVGTRYCSNNCPYKVRRFNFFQYADIETPSLRLLRNPDVTVRSRGVMEKCTYCVQRINATRIEAKKEERQIRDGEVQTACQAACPTQAIVFGDINDPESQVTRLKADPRSYGLLTELNTKPRTTYLARLRNPNPELEAEKPVKDEAHGH